MPNKEGKFNNFDDPEAIPGVIVKVATVKELTVTDDDLSKINQYTLSPVTAEDVYAFKATLADNEQDDRNYMPFNRKALEDLKKLYPGKTMLKDHFRSADKQIGRVYDTELVTDSSKTTALGEKHTELIAKVYMIKTESNADLIAEIEGGIKKEVSTSCVPDKMICNICGVDNMKDYCRHWPGVEYEVSEDGKNAKKTCQMLIDGAKDAYEVSFVAVPAQPRAGAHKSVGFAKPVEEKEEADEPVEVEAPDVTTNENKSAELELRARDSEAFYFTNNHF